MVIIELTYIKSLDAVEQCLQEHRDFLTIYYDKGIFIASGPKMPRDGGIILANTTREEAQNLIKDDPFYLNGIAKYQITQFEPNKCSQEFRVIIE